MLDSDRRVCRQPPAIARGCFWSVALCWALLSSTPAMGAVQPSREDINHIELAAKLIGDGHFDRAAELLSKLDPAAKGVDKKKMFSLQGVVFLEKKQFAESARSFAQAVAEGPVQPVVHYYLAQAHFGVHNYEQCLVALAAAGSYGKQRDGFLLGAQASWEVGKTTDAIALLTEGIKRLPLEGELKRRKIFFLVELKLYQEVVSLSRDFLSRSEVSVDDYVAVGEALLAGGQLAKAQLLLEQARLKFSHNESVALHLAHAYLQASQPATAGRLFEEAAVGKSKYYLEAAETFKQAGRIARAFRNNARIVDQKEKLKQRLSLLLVDERFEEVAAMEPALSRFGLLTDDSVRYALAFAFFNTGQLERAESRLAGLSGSTQFDAAVELRRAIARCRDAGWECSQ